MQTPKQIFLQYSYADQLFYLILDSELICIYHQAVLLRDGSNNQEEKFNFYYYGAKVVESMTQLLQQYYPSVKLLKVTTSCDLSNYLASFEIKINTGVLYNHKVLIHTQDQTCCDSLSNIYEEQLESLMLDKYSQYSGKLSFLLGNKEYQLTLQDKLYQAIDDESLLEVNVIILGNRCKLYVKYALVNHVITQWNNSHLSMPDSYYELLTLNLLLAEFKFRHNIEIQLHSYKFVASLANQRYYYFVGISSLEASLNTYMLVDMNTTKQLLQLFHDEKIGRVIDADTQLDLPVYIDGGYLSYQEYKNLCCGDTIVLNALSDSLDDLYLDGGNTRIKLQQDDTKFVIKELG